MKSRSFTRDRYIYKHIHAIVKLTR